MPLKEKIIEEFKRGPITVTATVIGVLVAAISLLVALLQYAGPPMIATSIAGPTTSSFQLTNFLLVTSFFIASSTALASLIHSLDQSYPFHAMILSVPTAVLSAFLSLVVLQLAPPRPITEQTFKTAKDVVFWATLFVFLAINGRSTAESIIIQGHSERPHSETEQSSGRKNDIGGEIAILLIMLVVWSSFFSAGLSKLVQLFLE
ncbi:hypothetical protein [uncultured Castellaniella sp.]|mgnify:CR=1 FL=1|uniref:hypothetical protein n=1 Tax=uncultured Castellaniella sp. TaxID=647907 RepID=UPI002619DA0C|nr:hypothetical protein [uncultured Castellaniella sp.]